MKTRQIAVGLPFALGSIVLILISIFESPIRYLSDRPALVAIGVGLFLAAICCWIFIARRRAQADRERRFESANRTALSNAGSEWAKHTRRQDRSVDRGA